MAAALWAALGSTGVGLGPGAARAADLYGRSSELDPELRTLLAAQDPDQRRRAVERLEALDSRVAGPHLVERLKDPDAGVRARAARALAIVTVVDATPSLLDGLSDPSPTVRADCARALGLIGAFAKELRGRATGLLARATSDAQHEVRREVLLAIERLLRSQALGPKDGQQLLGPVLLRGEDENVSVRRAAALVLGRIGQQTADAGELRGRIVVALLGRLSDAARDVRAEALASLAALGEKTASAAALRLVNDPTEEVRRQAALCLGKLGVVEAVPVLAEQFQSKAEATRKTAAQALTLLAQQKGPNPTTPHPAVAGALRALIDGLATEERRALARESILEIGTPAIAPLLARLRDLAASQAEVASVVDLLSVLTTAPTASPTRAEVATAITGELLRGRIPREQVIDALSQIADPVSAPLLAGLLEDRDEAVRRKALRGLERGRLLDERALDAVVKASRDPDRALQKLATHALGELAGGTPRLLELLQAEDATLRTAAGEALAAQSKKGAPPDPTVARALVQAVARPGDSALADRARRVAAFALGQIALRAPAMTPSLVSDLLAAIRRERGRAETLPALVTALGGVTRGRPSEAVQKTLLDFATAAAEPGSPDAALAIDALDALSAIRDPEAAPKLLRLLSHRDPLRRLHAVTALGNLSAAAVSEATVAGLLHTLAEDSDGRVTAEAAWALGKLRAQPRDATAQKAATALRRALLRSFGPSADRAVRTNILSALARLGLPEVEDVEWLGDADPGLRGNAALLVGSLARKSPGIEARLRSLIAVDEDGRVRRAAEKALSGAPLSAAGERIHFLSMLQTDYDQHPRSESRYRLTLPDGLMRVGLTDSRGYAREELLPEGLCQVELVEVPPTAR